MEKKPRFLTVSESVNYHPKITLTGAWLQGWGFTTGDHVSVNRTEAGEILIKVSTSSAQWAEIRRKKQLEDDFARAGANLQSHRSANPAVYAQVEAAMQACRTHVAKRVIRTRRRQKPKPDIAPTPLSNEDHGNPEIKSPGLANG